MKSRIVVTGFLLALIVFAAGLTPMRTQAAVIDPIPDDPSPSRAQTTLAGENAWTLLYIDGLVGNQHFG